MVECNLAKIDVGGSILPTRSSFLCQCCCPSKSFSTRRSMRKPSALNGNPLPSLRKENEETYNKNPKYCLKCGLKIEFSKRENTYCSHSCAGYDTTPKVKDGQCGYCGNPIILYKTTKNSIRKYCSASCSNKNYSRLYIERWLLGKENGSDANGNILSIIRRYMLNKAGNKCQKCGWCTINPTTGTVPVQIEHKNGNSTDQSIDNLEILCPNCHSLTSTFGGLNRGNGRKNRKR